MGPPAILEGQSLESLNSSLVGNQSLILKLELALGHGQTAQLKVGGSMGTRSLCINPPGFWMNILFCLMVELASVWTGPAWSEAGPGSYLAVLATGPNARMLQELGVQEGHGGGLMSGSSLPLTSCVTWECRTASLSLFSCPPSGNMQLCGGWW